MAAIKIDGYEKEAVIKKGLRQGCSLSSLLFNLFIEYALKDIRENCKAGIKIHGETVQLLRFSEGILSLANKKKELEEVLNCMDRILDRNYKMIVNKKKKT